MKKIGIEKFGISSLSTLLSVEDWEWFYLSRILIKDGRITIQDIVQIILGVNKTKNITIKKEKIADLILKDPCVIKKRLTAIVKIQKWFKRKLAVRRIEKWWVHHCYKPSSKGEKRVAEHFSRIQQKRGTLF